MCVCVCGRVAAARGRACAALRVHRRGEFFFFLGSEEQVRDEKKGARQMPSHVNKITVIRTPIYATVCGRKAAIWGQCTLLFFSHGGGGEGPHSE